MMKTAPFTAEIGIRSFLSPSIPLQAGESVHAAQKKCLKESP